MRIRRVTIDGLNELFTHTINFNLEEHLTIVHSPNGYGKTSVLRLLSSLFQGSLTEIRDIPFWGLLIEFTDGRELIIEKRPTLGETYRCKFVLRQNQLTLASKELELDAQAKRYASRIRTRLPSYRQLDDEFWEDTIDGEIVATQDVLRRAGLNQETSVIGSIEWLTELVSQLDVKYIQTQRLTAKQPPGPRRYRSISKTSDQAPNAVANYAANLSKEIKGVLAQYAETSSRLDQSFPTRLLNGSRSIVPRSDLDRVVSDLETQRRRLRAVGLLEKEDEQVALPWNIEGALQNALSIYLGDVERKLGVFAAMLEKLELFKQIIDEHFSFKRMSISKEKGFVFETPTHGSLDPSSLSSGEQHILILVYDLLFSSRPDSLILIDEPEISLHVSWQVTFLEDIQRIAKLSSNDFLIATHSPQIINDRWDLTVELKPPNETVLKRLYKTERSETAPEQVSRFLALDSGRDSG